jgi:hypothetical protein
MVYVCSFEGVTSGGPELLHQLVYVLNALEVPAKIAYLRNDFPIEIVDAKPVELYRDYCEEAESDLSVIDAPGNVIVVPEMAFELFEQIHHATKVAWWLSVDNYVMVLQKAYGLTQEETDRDSNLDYFHFQEQPEVIHLAQSYYAIDFLENHLHIPKEQVGYLSDYINDLYLQVDAQSLGIERKNMVLFNPVKGKKRLKKLIDATQDEILWIPLANLSREKMRLHMLLAKVYVDFGNHPGKDRFPREAAMCGCCAMRASSRTARSRATRTPTNGRRRRAVRRKSAAICRTRGGCTTCAATWPSGALTTMPRSPRRAKSIRSGP